MSPERLAQVDIAAMNLLCAQGLPHAEQLEMESCFRRLDEWAALVRLGTDRQMHQFRAQPDRWDNSEGVFHMDMLVALLQLRLKVQYDEQRKSPDISEPEFFADSRSLFLHGLLSDARVGTCASLPVLYVAVGRRLGYPLKLVSTARHLFARWESTDGKERFNIEATNRGLNTHPDSYYRSWPFNVTDADVTAEGYLRSLTPREELAKFLALRQSCLMSHRLIFDAAQVLVTANQLAPHIRRFRVAMPALAKAVEANIADFETERRQQVALSRNRQNPLAEVEELNRLQRQLEYLRGLKMALLNPRTAP